MNGIQSGLMATALLWGSVYGQVPNTNNTSDASANIGLGYDALSGNGIVNSPCPVGEPSLASYRCFNTAVGNDALALDATGGNYNTGVGAFVLYQNTTGYYNTATGAGALEQNTTGSNNTAVGFGALSSNIVGDNSALSSGSNNTASGSYALHRNTIGINNTTSGTYSLLSNTTGYNNTASGYGSLQENTQGNNNTGIGVEALINTTTGSGNIAVGVSSGYYLTTGVNNIFIGAEGDGSPTESNTVRIGTQGVQTSAWMAGITSSKITGSAVYITPWGQLGVLASSERYKTDVHAMTGTKRLNELRPVTFHLRTDPNGELQYGLIAEEVAKVYPDLVTRDEKGRIDGVRYDELAPMLLNEVKRQQREIAALMNMNRETQAAVAKLQSQLRQ